ncbi:hypothetical protein HN446_00315 [bacterium]|nr:hypothetical protein [bacterium]
MNKKNISLTLLMLVAGFAATTVVGAGRGRRSPRALPNSVRKAAKAIRKEENRALRAKLAELEATMLGVRPTEEDRAAFESASAVIERTFLASMAERIDALERDAAGSSAYAYAGKRKGRRSPKSE